MLIGTRLHRRAPDGLGNLEDFLAIMITNIYVSERSRPPSHLRADHALVFHELPDELKDPVAYEDRYREGIKALSENPKCEGLVQQLANIQCDYNPLRVFQDRVSAKLREKNNPFDVHVQLGFSPPPRPE
jgi:hypothetical protein